MAKGRKQTIMGKRHSLTVCLLNWRRPVYLRQILDALSIQVPRPTIFLWNNAAEAFHHEAVDWLIHSSRNAICPPRWWMAAQAETQFVASLDDDLLPLDRTVLSDATEVAAAQPPRRVIGPYGARFKFADRYFPHQTVTCPERDEVVDLVKGRCMVIRTETIRTRLRLGQFFRDPDTDDIAICGQLAGGKRGCHLVPGIFRGRFKSLPEGNEALYRRPEHAARRNEARVRWFPEERA